MASSKPHLNDPLRIHFHKELRQTHKLLWKNPESPLNFVRAMPLFTTLSKPEQNYFDLKQIYLNDMVPKFESIYDNRILKLTIIEEPNWIGSTSGYLLAEDDRRNVTLLTVYDAGHPLEDDVKAKLGFGTVILIVNPYNILPLSDPNQRLIRVERLKNIILAGRKKDMCRYCGEENAAMKCTKCKRLYCGRECQEGDWKLGHKYVCPT